MIQQAQQVNDIIDHLAAKLSVPVGHLWGVLTSQAHVEALTSWAWAGIWFVLACAVCATAWRLRVLLNREDADYARRKEEWKQSKSGDGWYEREPETGEARFRILAVQCLLCGFLFSSAARGLIDGMRYQANPEYYALQQVLATVAK